MKHFLPVLLALSILFIEASSQTPQLINYQTVVRNTTGQIIQNHMVSLRISILRGSMSGPIVYSEAQSDSVNALGMMTISIGGGNPITGAFSAIDWSAGPYFLETEIDASGGTNYSLAGKSQLLSVPYAFYAGK